MKSEIKLSKRLQQIEKMVSSPYAHIWDCCCDHGLLGMALLSHQSSSTVHFVDIVPDLMAKLTHKLERFFSNATWQSHCIDVAKLPLTQYQGKHLVIIAGVGGDLMMQFIAAITQQHKHLELDFLLCPVHHQYALRQQLIALNFTLKDEVLIEDNQRFYEIMLVSSSSKELSEKHRKISPVGDKIWQATSNMQSDTANKYLLKTLQHYQRIQQGSAQGSANNPQHIIDAYLAVKR
ncbi:MAG: tRNA (adenine(22)-N(1))-methyltransferase [Cognaticolwellia sp.]